MKIYPRYIGAAAFSLVFAVAAFGQAAAIDTNAKPTSSPNNGDKVKTTLKHGDKSFVEDAAKSGMEEVAISRIAVEKASNPQVKEFAQMMVSHHTAASSELTALAAAKGVTLAKEPNVEKWAKKDAKGFDEAYMEKMVNDHQEAVKLFEKEFKNGDDPELTAFASKTLPQLQEHLAKAKEIKKMVR